MASLPYATAGKLREMLRESPFPEDIHPGNVFRMLAQAPPAGAAALGLIYSVLTETELDPGLREMAILRVAQRSHAGYAFAQHAPIARSAGVSRAQISSLQDGGAPAGLFGDRERAVLAFTAEALDAPRVCGETFARLREHLPPRQVVELLLTIGCFRMMSRLVTILELESEPPFGVDTLRQARQATARH